jgi:DNA-binding Lrp family transcriptional regulator
LAKSLSELDRKLLGLLRDNSRESFVHLAEALGTSEGTVRSRVKRLCDTGVIRQFTIKTTGANVKALIEVISDTHVDTSKVAKQIARRAGVEIVYETSGTEDLVAVVEADDTDELNALIEDIRKLKSVRSTRTRLILKEVF